MDQNTSGNSNGDSSGKVNKAVNDGGVSNVGNMDGRLMMFTSDVSLPKDGKQVCEVNK